MKQFPHLNLFSLLKLIIKNPQIFLLKKQEYNIHLFIQRKFIKQNSTKIKRGETCKQTTISI